MGQHLTNRLDIFQSFALLDPYALDFTWAIMFITKVSNHANLTFLFGGQPFFGHIFIFLTFL